MQNIIRVQRVANPSTKRRKSVKKAASGRRKVSSRRRRRSNPLRVLTLGASNPRRKKMAARKTRRRRTTRRRRNVSHGSAVRAVARRRRRTTRAANPRRRRRNATRITIRRTRRNRRRNPQLFGSSVTTAKMAEAVLGGLVGVTAAKLIPANLPGNLTATPTMRILSSVASAFGAGWVAGRLSKPFGDAVLFGGLMQAGSLVLNAFIPTLGSQIGLQGMRGLGELMAGAYPVPQNPLNPMQANYPMYGRPVMAAADATYGNGAPVAMNGIARAFGRAF